MTQNLIIMTLAGNPEVTCTLYCSESISTTLTPVPVTIVFSEAVIGFAVGDLTLSNCTASNFAGGGDTYTVDITPTAPGYFTVQVLAGVCTDLALNPNTASNQINVYYYILLLKDEFTTAEAAPMASPRTCEPGPGTLTLVDTGNKLSIASGQLLMAGLTGGADPKFDTNAISRVTGIIAMVKNMQLPAGSFNNGNVIITDNQFAIPTGVTFIRSSSSLIYAEMNTAGPGAPHITWSDTYPNTVFIVYVSGVYYTIAYDGTSFRLLYVTRMNLVGANMGIRYAVGNSMPTTGQIGEIEIVQAGAPWNTDTGIATDSKASPASGNTLTHTADGIVECSWTAGAGETFELSFRRTDDDNRWIVRCDQAGSTIKLIQRQGGAETEQSSAAQTWTVGTVYRVTAIFIGNDIKTLTKSNPTAFAGDTQKNAYASGSFNATATGAKVAGFATAANFVSYPYYLTGAAATTLGFF